MDGTYRHELKYTIHHGDYLILQPRLRTVLQLDSHAGPSGVYYIHSIYFDNYQDKALREKIDGVQKREKFRIRWYNDNLSFLTLEKKMKVNDLCMKFDAEISLEQCKRILKGDTGWMLTSGNALLQEFSCKQKQLLLQPRVLVSYRREPYVYAPGNVRVTFDSHVRTSLYDRDFFRASRTDIDADDSGQIILEVKYDRYLPEIVRDLLQLGRFRQNAFSKYGVCRRYG